MKKCNKCFKVKNESEFYSGRLYCKSCKDKIDLDRLRTKEGLIRDLYRHQHKSSKKRGHKPPNYTLEQLREWILSQKNFEKLYSNWVNSNYNKMKRPSCDRKDDYKGYCLSRLQLMTWEENDKKAHQDIKNGINNKQSKAVIRIDVNTLDEVEYKSISIASRINKSHKAAISRVCLGKQITASGYYWKYKENEV